MKKTKSTITRRKGTKKKPVIRAGSKSQQLQRKEPVVIDPKEREVKETISALKVIAFLLGVVMIGIVVFVAIAMLGKGKGGTSAPAPTYVDNDDRPPGAGGGDPLKYVTFRDDGDKIIMTGKSYEVVTPDQYREKIADYQGVRVAMKGLLTNSDVYKGAYSDAKKTHCAFKLKGIGGTITLYFNRTSGERLQKNIDAAGGISAHVVVILPKSRYKANETHVTAEIAKYRPTD